MIPGERSSVPLAGCRLRFRLFALLCLRILLMRIALLGRSQCLQTGSTVQVVLRSYHYAASHNGRMGSGRRPVFIV
ncbi:hypothetical protein B0O99DRAFT_644330, partial [Bisporella sp. PMI_857]